MPRPLAYALLVLAFGLLASPAYGADGDTLVVPLTWAIGIFVTVAVGVAASLLTVSGLLVTLTAAVFRFAGRFTALETQAAYIAKRVDEQAGALSTVAVLQQRVTVVEQATTRHDREIARLADAALRPTG